MMQGGTGGVNTVIQGGTGWWCYYCDAGRDCGC